jgi:hypothetical protein
MAGFAVTIYGRIWVSAEVLIAPIDEQHSIGACFRRCHGESALTYFFGSIEVVR